VAIGIDALLGAVFVFIVFYIVIQRFKKDRDGAEESTPSALSPLRGVTSRKKKYNIKELPLEAVVQTQQQTNTTDKTS